MYQLTSHTKTISSLAYSPELKRLFSGSGDFNIYIWDLKAENKKEPEGKLIGHTGSVN